MGNKRRLRKVMTAASLAAVLVLLGACGDAGGDVKDENSAAETVEPGSDAAADSGGQEGAGTGTAGNAGTDAGAQTEGTVGESGRREYGAGAYLSGLQAWDFVKVGEFKGI